MTALRKLGSALLAPASGDEPGRSSTVQVPGAGASTRITVSLDFLSAATR